MNASAAGHGRAAPRYSVSLRPIIADTEQAAWDRAAAVLEATTEGISRLRRSFPISAQVAEGSKRLLDAAADRDVHDTRLWTAVAKATGAPGNTTALVGTTEQVAEALLEYVKLGVSTLLIRGFDPLPDALAYRDVVQLVREEAHAQGLGLPELTRTPA